MRQARKTVVIYLDFAPLANPDADPIGQVHIVSNNYQPSLMEGHKRYRLEVPLTLDLLHEVEEVRLAPAPEPSTATAFFALPSATDEDIDAVLEKP